MATVNKNEVYWLEQIADTLAGGGNLPVLTVVGTIFDAVFVPYQGQPTYAEAAAHYLAGGAVRIKVVYDFDEGAQTYTGSIVGHYTEGKLFYVFPDSMSTSGGAAKIYFWNEPDNND